MAELVTMEVATVWRYGGRRYLTKRSAFMAKALTLLQAADDHEAVEPTEPPCCCLTCEDRQNNWAKRKAIASMLAKGLTVTISPTGEVEVTATTDAAEEG